MPVSAVAVKIHCGEGGSGYSSGMALGASLLQRSRAAPGEQCCAVRGATKCSRRGGEQQEAPAVGARGLQAAEGRHVILQSWEMSEVILLRFQLKCARCGTQRPFAHP